MSKFIESALFSVWATLIVSILGIIVAGIESGAGLSIFVILATTALPQTLALVAIIWTIVTIFTFLLERK